MLIAMLLLSVSMAGCTSAYYRTSSYASDDLYGTHSQTEISKRQQAEAEAQKAAAQARKAQWEARIAEAEAEAAENSYYSSNTAPTTYQSVLADTYESAYARRLYGFESPSYNMPSSYYNLRYSSAYNYVTAYDPAFYNVMVMGDQVWVEPKYITSMFGTWGQPSRFSFGFSSGFYNDWYMSWGYYPRYSWWDWNWNICYRPYYDPWWGPSYPMWGHHHYPYYPSWGGGYRPSNPNIVHRPSPYQSPSTGRQYGSGSRGTGGVSTGSGAPGYNRGSGSSFGVRGGSTSGGNSSYNTGRGTRNDNNNSYRGGSRTNNSGSSSYRNNNSNSNNYDSYNRNNSNSSRSDYSSPSYNRGSSSSGSSGGGYSSGSGAGSGGGRNPIGR